MLNDLKPLMVWRVSVPLANLIYTSVIVEMQKKYAQLEEQRISPS